jgi:hypothetical protein
MLDDVLTRERRGMWFYAHAGGLADMQFVLDEILSEIKRAADVRARERITFENANSGMRKRGVERHTDHVAGEWKVRASFSGSSAIIVHVSKGKNAWHFVDSYWLLRDKLSNIGKALKLGKGDAPVAIDWMKGRFGKDKFDDLNPTERKIFYADAPMNVLVSYNRVDCAILWKAIKQFEEEVLILGGQLQQTIASTGMNLFRRAYLKRDICTSEKVNKIAEESYFASRVEVISRVGTDVKMFDINSSFPYSMTFPQPAGLSAISTRLPDDDSDSCIYIADVTVSVPDMHLPPIPYRQGGRVFFPVGRWRCWLTSVDVGLALKQGCKVLKVHEVYHFDPFEDIRGYASDIYAKRAAADTEFRKLVLKYLLNSLYGKFAENQWKQEMLINPSAEELDREKLQMLQPGVWLRDKQSLIAHRHVPISTHITSLSRRLLYQYAMMCYEQGKPSLYFDTDSLVSAADLPTDDKKLGALKLEKKLNGEFVAPKIYRGEGFKLGKNGQWEVEPTYFAKAKGFSLDRISVPGIADDSPRSSYDKLGKIIDGDRLGAQRMIRMRELLRTQEGNEYLSAPVEIMVVKALTFEMLSKRFHYPDGETRPWSIDELRSGDVYPKGFDFEPEILDKLDTTTKAMMGAIV